MSTRTKLGPPKRLVTDLRFVKPDGSVCINSVNVNANALTVNGLFGSNAALALQDS